MVLVALPKKSSEAWFHQALLFHFSYQVASITSSSTRPLHCSVATLLLYVQERQIWPSSTLGPPAPPHEHSTSSSVHQLFQGRHLASNLVTYPFSAQAGMSTRNLKALTDRSTGHATFSVSILSQMFSPDVIFSRNSLGSLRSWLHRMTRVQWKCCRDDLHLCFSLRSA